ncbi:tripartite tricarboxylate transporter TctB family protein [Bosea sp. (in: a-proteobacteria)]|uniref:tripartite tricarboxylate transporter TctB family protein n=1 Tax=Bosea sp. (in: a-proteobacteria) TaxID=1871050 RepID=UPI0025C155A4|nr:tripartite tricarboxylate transporter TctB family protein [Bosea sp. (in: a-proteobacteria)]MBR3189809.1 tripartite tricarboxylate transporter TctB family protein [Bosea sp. (in: a-proteobacteria)]
MRFNDAAVGFVFILIAAAMIAMTFSFPAFPGQQYGPSLFPRIIGAGIIGCSALLIVRGFREHAAGGRWLQREDWTGVPRRVASFALMLGAMAFYVVASEPLGFIPCAFLIQLVLFLWFGVRPVTAVVVAVVVTGLVHWFFSSLMRVPLPRGVLDSVL